MKGPLSRLLRFPLSGLQHVRICQSHVGAGLKISSAGEWCCTCPCVGLTCFGCLGEGLGVGGWWWQGNPTCCLAAVATWGRSLQAHSADQMSLCECTHIWLHSTTIFYISTVWFGFSLPLLAQLCVLPEQLMVKLQARTAGWRLMCHPSLGSSCRVPGTTPLYR